MRVDFHIHTKHSYDSFMKPRKVVEIARRRGLDGIAVTDHETIMGGAEASKLAKETGIFVIIGCEVATEIGDVVGLFLEKEIESRRSEEVLKEIREQGGLSVLPHPLRGHKYPGGFPAMVDVIETHNSRSNRSQNQGAAELAKQYRKPFVAGSDAHLYSEIGLSTTKIDCPDPRAIKGCLLSGKAEPERLGVASRNAANYSNLVKYMKKRQYGKMPGGVVRAITGLRKRRD